MDQALYNSIMQQHDSGCVFCEPHPALMLHETEHFGVCFDPAPLTPGHLIIYSKAHLGCAGEVAPEQMPDLLALRKWALRRLETRFERATFYEHGRAGSCIAGRPEDRFCHHFHLHCIPGDFDLIPELSARFQAVPLPNYSDITEVFELYGDYLYVHAHSWPSTYFVADGSVEAHLLRSLIAARLGRPERADWSSYRAPELLAAGMAAIGSPAMQNSTAS